MKRRIRDRTRRRGLLAALVLAVAFAPIEGPRAAPLRPESVRITVEAEQFARCHDVDFDPVRAVETRLHGLGAPGEWVEYDLQLSNFGSYVATLVCWGEIGVTYTMRLSYGEDDMWLQTIAFTFAGNGDYTVCGRVLFAGGSEPLAMHASPCALRLEYVSGSPIAGAFWADCLTLDSIVAAEGAAWGAVKSLFRSP